MPTQFDIRLDDDLLRRVEGWRRDNPLVPSVPDAVTALVRQALDGGTNAPLGMFEKLSLILLAQLCRKAGVEEPIDPGFLQQSVQRGHAWAIEWQYPSLTTPHANSSAHADFVTRVLTIWRRIADSVEALPAEERARLCAAAGIEEGLGFPGFDHDREINYSSIARFMVEQLDLFPSLRRSAMRDSRRPMLAAYREMIRVYEDEKSGSGERLLDADQLGRVLAGLAPPSGE